MHIHLHETVSSTTSEGRVLEFKRKHNTLRPYSPECSTSSLPRGRWTSLPGWVLVWTLPALTQREKPMGARATSRVSGEVLEKAANNNKSSWQPLRAAER